MIVALDFETYYDNDISLTKMSVAQYLRHPEVDIYQVAVVSDTGIEWVGNPRDFAWESLGNDWTFVAANAAFDAECVSALRRNGLIPDSVVPKEIHCVLDMSRYLAGVGNLKDAAKALLKREMTKEYRKTAKGKHGSDFTETEWLSIRAAGLDDARNTVALWKEWGQYWPQWERDLSRITREGCSKGVRINRPVAEQYVAELTALITKLEEAIPWNGKWQGSYKTPLARVFIDAACVEAGIPIPYSVAKADEEFQEWLDEYSDDVPWVAAIKQWSGASRLLDVIQKMLLRLDEDDIMTFGLKYYGAVATGRWSGESGVNMHNPIYKNTLDPECPYKHVDLLGLYIPRKDWYFIAPDLSQIEPRTLNWIVKNTRFLEACKYTSAYEADAIAVGAWSRDKGDLKKVDKKLYAYFKGRCLSCQYQAGWRKAISMFSTYGINPYEIIGFDATDDEVAEFIKYLEMLDEFMKSKVNTAQIKGVTDKKLRLFCKSWKMVTRWRDENPKIVDMWKRMQIAFEAAIGEETFTVKLPSGRKQIYYYPTKHKGEFIAWPNALKRTDKQNGPSKIYGGKIVARFNQGTARDVVGDIVVRCDKELGIKPLWTKHDEGINEVRIVDSAQALSDLQRIYTTAPLWMPGLPLATEAEITERYKK